MRVIAVVSMERLGDKADSAHLVAEERVRRADDKKSDRYRYEGGVIHLSLFGRTRAASGEVVPAPSFGFMANMVPPNPTHTQLITGTKPLRVY
jgi:hypothetical protein